MALPPPTTLTAVAKAIADITSGQVGLVDTINQNLKSAVKDDVYEKVANATQLLAGVSALLVLAPEVTVGLCIVSVVTTILKVEHSASQQPAAISHIDLGDFVALLGLTVQIMGAVFPAGSLAAHAATSSGISILGLSLIQSYVHGGIPGVMDDVTIKFHRAMAWHASGDPLAIDLDGNGIQTLGIGANPVLFDASGNGVKTGTGWLAPTDGWLVLDRNGNGTIDSGQELFGVDTVVANADGSTRKANSGFDALKSLDTGDGTSGSAGYRDGVFDANDAAFTQVRVWQDLNGDGISQSNELLTLDQEGIFSISLNSTNETTLLANGNSVTGTSTVTFASGTSTQVGAVDLASSTAGNLGLASNPFYRQFTDPVALTEQAKALPSMTGSGWVRDMREAASLGTSAADEFASALAQYSQATTRTAQMGSIDDLITAWAATSGRLDTRYFALISQTTNSSANANSVYARVRAEVAGKVRAHETWRRPRHWHTSRAVLARHRSFPFSSRWVAAIVVPTSLGG